MKREILDLWPEIEWIEDSDLREKVTNTWTLALENSVLSAADLQKIPFTFLVPDLKVSFMDHKRSVVHISRQAGENIIEFYGDAASREYGCPYCRSYSCRCR